VFKGQNDQHKLNGNKKCSEHSPMDSKHGQHEGEHMQNLWLASASLAAASNILAQRVYQFSTTQLGLHSTATPTSIFVPYRSSQSPTNALLQHASPTQPWIRIFGKLSKQKGFWSKDKLRGKEWWNSYITLVSIIHQQEPKNWNSHACLWFGVFER
jgi:hypothetical protein